MSLVDVPPDASHRAASMRTLPSSAGIAVTVQPPGADRGAAATFGSMDAFNAVVREG